jgi:hypothetical protein
VARTPVRSRKRGRIRSTPERTQEDKRADVYVRLGVKEEEVGVLPRISHILSALPGGVDKAVEYMRGSGEAEVRKWLIVYDSIPVSMRGLVPFEAYCLAANLTTKRVLELVTGACFEQSDAAASLIAKSAKPDVVAATVRGALSRRGTHDRKMMHLHEGFIPVPKTSITNVRGDVIQDNRTAVISVGELGGVESKMARIGSRYNDRLGISGDQRLIEGECVGVGESESDPEEPACTPNP